MNKIVVICGPTASGKTQFAHFLAKKKKGEIVNADSMQLYKQLPIITSSPSFELKNELPYHLYNFLDVESEYCVAKYVKEAAKKIGLYNIKYKYSADYDYFYRMIVKHKLSGIGTKKNELFGIFARGGFSSGINFYDHMCECTRIRIDNGQNKIMVLLSFII